MKVPIFFSDGSLRAEALVDESDYEELMQWRWHLAAGRYAARSARKPERHMIYMHRQILGLGLGDKREADHINRNTLDNRRGNLRVVTSQQNSQNQPGQPYKTSVHRGVSWHAQRGYWVVRIKANGKNQHLGCFHDEDEAAQTAQKFYAANMPYSNNTGEVGALEELKEAWRAVG